MDPAAVLVALLGSANLSSRHWVYQQYDSSVQSNTVEWPGHGAAVLRVKGTKKALVATTDGNQTVSAIDPHLGAQLSVAEATRNVSITGARPLGITNCLNYGNPERPEAFWQLQEAVRGMAEACRALSVAVTGATCRSTTSTRAVPSRRLRRSALSGCSRTSRCSWGRLSPRMATQSY